MVLGAVDGTKKKHTLLRFYRDIIQTYNNISAVFLSFNTLFVYSFFPSMRVTYGVDSFFSENEKNEVTALNGYDNIDILKVFIIDETPAHRKKV